MEFAQYRPRALPNFSFSYFLYTAVKSIHYCHHRKTQKPNSLPPRANHHPARPFYSALLSLTAASPPAQTLILPSVIRSLF